MNVTSKRSQTKFIMKFKKDIVIKYGFTNTCVVYLVEKEEEAEKIRNCFMKPEFRQFLNV